MGRAARWNHGHGVAWNKLFMAVGVGHLLVDGLQASLISL